MRTFTDVLNDARCCALENCKESCFYYSDDGANSCKSALLSECANVTEFLIVENSNLRNELDSIHQLKKSGKYWDNICQLNAKQESKGLEKYGEPLEENTTLTTTQRIEHLEEELIDALKYCEHLKQVANDGITANDYQRAAMRTDNKEQTEEERMLDALFGLCGEAGEVMDAYKKHRFQGHDEYKDKMIEELGDNFWYSAKLADVLGVTLGEVMDRNIEKLRKRFPNGFSKERSVNRKE